jgi:5-methylcytosine-specific restriction endonuclease McrA
MKSGKSILDRTTKYRSLREYSKLKEMFIVRYADDFKIFCRDHKTAFNVFEAVKKWLKERLGLDISPEKSKVINLRKNYSEFLGFKFKVVPKEKKRVVKSKMSGKAKQNAITKIKTKIEAIKRTSKKAEVNKFNSTILGLHNFYQQATDVSQDFAEIAFSVKRTLYNKLRKLKSKKGKLTPLHQKAYKEYLNKKPFFVCGVAIFPIDGVKHKHPVNFTQEKSNYTAEGRKLIHNNQQAVPTFMIHYMMENPIKSQSMEYNDNRIAKFVAQLGKCAISGEPLEIGFMELHHKKPKSKGGTDSYQNLIFLYSYVHKLVHAVNDKTIRNYLSILKLSDIQLRKLNGLRKQIGNSELVM